MMVERVARAICEADGVTWRTGTYEVASGPNFETEERPLDPFNNRWRYLAKAAIDAILSTGDDAGLVERALAAYERGEMDAAGTIEALYEHDLSLTARNKALEEALRAERTKTDKLAAWLYDACDGFPVSQEAFDAFTADDLKATGAAIANRADEQCMSLEEFKAKVAALNHQDNRQNGGGE
jgi:hypothetical protein